MRRKILKNKEKKITQNNFYELEACCSGVGWSFVCFLLYMNEMRQNQAKRLTSVGRKTAFFFA